MISLLKHKVDLLDSVEIFMKNYANFASSISFSQRSRFVILDHSVNEEFILKIYYDKERFGHLIDQFVNEMIREIKSNKELNDDGWNNTVVFVKHVNNFAEYFNSCFFNSSNLLNKRKKCLPSMLLTSNFFKNQELNMLFSTNIKDQKIIKSLFIV